MIAEAVLPIQREAEKSAIELLRLVDVEDAENRDRRLNGNRGRCRFLLFKLGRKDIPLIEPELPGNDLQGFTMGEVYVAGSQSLPQSFRHEFGVAKIAHDSFLTLAANRMISARVC